MTSIVARSFRTHLKSIRRQRLDLFFDTNDFYLSEKEIKMGLVPERLRGETAAFDIKLGRKLIVEEGRRITAKHVRDMEKSTVNKLIVTAEYLEGKILAHDIVDTETGELLAAANAELTPELIEALTAAGIDHFRTLYVNDLDRGAFISNTLNIDPSTTRLEALVEIYRMMRPGEIYGPRSRSLTYKVCIWPTSFSIRTS